MLRAALAAWLGALILMTTAFALVVISQSAARTLRRLRARTGALLPARGRPAASGADRPEQIDGPLGEPAAVTVPSQPLPGRVEQPSVA